jgi:type I restriction enzyme M protein
VLPRNIWSGRVDQGDVDAVAAATAARQSRYRLDPGDIVCARTGTLGRYGLVSTSQAGWLVGPGCMRLRPNHRVRAAYLVHYLTSPEAFEWLMANSVKSVIRSISTNALRQLPVLLPPMPTQDEIVATLAAFDDQISTHRHLAEESEKLRDLLLPLVRPSATELDG